MRLRYNYIIFFFISIFANLIFNLFETYFSILIFFFLLFFQLLQNLRKNRILKLFSYCLPKKKKIFRNLLKELFLLFNLKLKFIILLRKNFIYKNIILFYVSLKADYIYTYIGTEIFCD